MRVGFIGLGNMGGPMCARLVAAGHRVRAFDLSADAMRRGVDAGATMADRAADCASEAEVVLTSLPKPEHVEAVMAWLEGL